MEYTFLKDNQTVGSTWTSAQFSGLITPDPPATPFTPVLRWEFTILGQNVSQIVNGTTYTNVIKVKQELKQEIAPGNWALAAYFDCYYARDKGLIKQDLFNNAAVPIYVQDVRRLVVY